MQKIDSILQRIDDIRILNQRSAHDCAMFLNISRYAYLRFEQGDELLSIPELELLAAYFRVSPTSFLSDHLQEDWFKVFDENLKSEYIRIRNKMIRAKLNSAIAKNGLTLEEIQEKTGITHNALQTYIQGKIPIPLDHLLLISDCLSLAESDFFESSWHKTNNGGDLDQEIPQNEWLSEDQNQFEISDNSYNNLLIALKSIPKKDQAEIAKIIFEKLISMKNG